MEKKLREIKRTQALAWCNINDLKDVLLKIEAAVKLMQKSKESSWI